LKVGFKDRLQDKLYSPLNDSILNRGNSELPRPAIPFGNLYPPILGGSVGPSDKLFLYAPKKLLQASSLNGFKAFSIKARRPVIGLECAPLTGEKNRELEGGVIGPTSG
jgi:hypothetical protein